MTATTIEQELPYRAPFDPGIFDFLAARCIPGVELGTRRSYARALRLPRGDGWFRAELHDDDGGTPRFIVTAELEDQRDTSPLLETIRRLFDLDAAPADIDPVLAPLMSVPGTLIPGIRLPGAVDPNEILIRAMMGQQVTVAAARTALIRLTELGSPSRVRAEGLQRHFPTAAQIADGGRALLRGPQRRIDAICNVAELLASSKLQLSTDDTSNELTAKLLPLPGIGPWTVGYVAMRVTGAPDIFLSTDVAVRNGIAALTGQSPSSSAAEAYARRFSPWRSYATLHLWRAAAAK